MSTESQDSIYLYAKDHRDLLVKNFRLVECPHKIKVMAFLDLDEIQRERDPFAHHLAECESCKKHYLKLLHSFQMLSAQLPWIKPSDQVRTGLMRKVERLSGKKTWWDQVHDMATYDLRPGLKAIWFEAQDPRWLVTFFVCAALIALSIYS